MQQLEVREKVKHPWQTDSISGINVLCSCGRKFAQIPRRISWTGIDLLDELIILGFEYVICPGCRKATSID